MHSIVRALALTALCITSAFAATPAQQSILLRPQRVFDAASAATHEGWVVLVSGDSIAAVGPASSVTVPAGATTIDLPGMTLLPGLIDAHSHVFLHPYNEMLWNDQVLPEKRLAVLLADLFGVHIASATIARISQGCAERCQVFADAVRDHVAKAPVKHMDETGLRVGGKTQWLHIASTVLLTFYRISPKRGSLMDNVSGIVVHDHWKPYYTLSGVLHALCNAHHLRELKALVEIEKEDWARTMQRLLRRTCHATNLAREANISLKPGLITLIARRYDSITAAGLAFHEAQPVLTKVGKRGRPPRRVGHNLLLRLATRKQDVLRFLTDPRVPFTNNLAEQDGRMMKLQQKISGSFRSEDGAKNFAVIRSVLSTARKQGWNMLQTLSGDPQHLIAALQVT